MSSELKIPKLSTIKALADSIPPEPLGEAEKERAARARFERQLRLDDFLGEVGKLVAELRHKNGQSPTRLAPLSRAEGFVAFAVAPLNGEDPNHLRLARIPDAYLATLSDGEFTITTPLPRKLHIDVVLACELKVWSLKAGSRVDWQT